MKIAMVSEHASPLAAIGGVDAGGQNVYVACLARALAARGHSVRVYTRRDDPHLPHRVSMPGAIEVVHLGAGPARHLPKDDLLPWMAELGRRLSAAWLADPQEQPDVVHAHFWMSGLASTDAVERVAALTGRRPPVVQTFHALGSVKRRMQGRADPSPRGRIGAERFLARGVDAVIATCRDEVAELERMGARPDRVAVVPCGVDLEHFTADGVAAVPERPFRPSVPEIPRGRRLLTVGRLVERKGVDDCVRALAMPELADVHLVVAGGPSGAALEDDREVGRVRDVARRAGVGDRVHLLGQVDRQDVPALVRWSDVVTTAPWYEPFGMVPLEAMACARPVVGTTVGGLLDTVDHGTTGLLVPPRCPDALARALAGLLASPQRRAALGAAGRARVQRRYGWEQVGAGVEDVYRTVAAPSEPMGVEVR